MEDAIGARPVEAYMGRDLLCIFESEDVVRGLSPDMEKLKALDGLLLQVTAKGREYDCVSRSFAPKLNVPEAVSYTHLDVYKRQDHLFPVR